MPALDRWRTGITRIADGDISYRGVLPIQKAMQESSVPAVVWLLFRGTLPTAPEEEVMRRSIIAAADHGLAAPSIAAARICASTRGAPGVAVAAGLCTFAGPSHGGAAQACAELLQKLDVGGEGAIKQYLDDCSANRIRTPGYGHPVHSRDPRVEPLMNSPGIESRRFRDLATELGTQLKASTKKDLPMNGDSALAAVLLDAGLGPLEIGLVGVLGRTIGLAAHVAEETLHESPFRTPSEDTIEFQQ